MAVNREEIIANKDDLRWDDLRWDDLRWADLRGADLRWADLRRADLRGADFRWADLRGADLRRADIHEADLREAKNIYLLQIQDPRGYSFAHAIKCGDDWRIRSGCRDFCIDAAKTHWGTDYKGERWIGDLYLAAIAQFEQWLATQENVTDHQEQ